MGLRPTKVDEGAAGGWRGINDLRRVFNRAALNLAELRSIQRDDRKDWAQGMDNWYGSRAQAVHAVVESHRRRWEGLEKTSLPVLHIDTREQDWRRYAETVRAYWMGA